MVFAADTMKNVEKLVLLYGTLGFSKPFIYDLTLHDGNVARGGKLTIDTTDLRRNGPPTIDGSAETNGKLSFLGGASGETFIGGGSRDILQGGGAADLLTGGGAADRFVYLSASDSTGSDWDQVFGFNASKDRFEFSFGVVGLEEAASGALTRSTVDADLAAVLDADHLAAYHAVLFTADGGNLDGRLMLIVDGNGIAGYQGGGEDYMIELVGATSLSDMGNAFVLG
jgi:Ca2+-binding RTX toxin-like protein